MSEAGASERAAALAAHPVFAGLSAEEREAATARARLARYDAGQWIVAHGDEDRDVYALVGGRVRVMLFGETRELILGDLSAGALFGDMSAIDGRPRSASVIALEASTALVLTPAAFLDLVHRHPPVCDAVLKLLVSRIRHLDDRVQEFSTLTIAERVRIELLRLARPRPGKANQGVVDASLTHQEIGARIGAHREAVTRELSALTRRRLIGKEGGRLVVLDVMGLSGGLGADWPTAGA